jgi:peptidyl-prolyl cis-trans isomerase SurA
MIARNAFCLVSLVCLVATAFAQKEEKESPSAAAPRGARVVDRIVAVVNEDVVTQRELDQRIGIVMRQLEKQGTPPPPRDQLSRQVLERVILSKVQLQFAKESGVKVEDAQIDRAVANIARDNKLTLTQFRSALQRDGVPFNKFRDDLRSEMTLGRLREREIDSKITVSDSEVDYQMKQEAQKPAAAGEDELLVAHIIVRIPEQATPEDIERRRKRAEEALAALKRGDSFGQVSATYSDAQEAMQGGAIGWRTPGKLPTLYADTLATMKKGEVSPLVKSGNGFHVLKLVDQRGKGAAQALTQTRVRHILIKTGENVGSAEAKRRIDQVKQRLAAGGDFAELAKTFSEDASATKGGEIGWVLPGDTIPEFERAMSALEIGAASEPVETPFGWHIIEALERKEVEQNAERNRAITRQALRQRKADEAFEEWLRQLRDRAYVEFRLDERI